MKAVQMTMPWWNMHSLKYWIFDSRRLLWKVFSETRELLVRPWVYIDHFGFNGVALQAVILSRGKTKLCL